MLFKVCSQKIDLNSDEWKNYLNWRNYKFTSFDSLDSNLRNSCYSPSEQDEFDSTFILDDHLTDITTSKIGALNHLNAHYPDGEILMFDFAYNMELPFKVLGYDILDGWYRYSLLTNYGNDIEYVNKYLSDNGLVKSINHIKIIHDRINQQFPNDGHTNGSDIFRVYKFEP